MRAARLEVGRWRVVLAAMFAAPSVPFVFIDVRFWLLVGFMAFFAGLFLLNAASSPDDEAEYGELTACRAGLTFRAQRLALEELRRVRVLPSERYADIDVTRHGWRRSLRFRVANTEAARTLVTAVGLDASCTAKTCERLLRSEDV